LAEEKFLGYKKMEEEENKTKKDELKSGK